jgi:phosphatidylglycerol:prolipoprotein diacylglycerol transferase
MFIHNIDPIITGVSGVYLWYYGLAYAAGFLGIHFWFRLQRDRLGLSMRQVYDLSILFAGGVLLGGRLLEVFVYEWPFYSAHPHLIPAVWLGGMCTHGILLGAVLGTWTFCRIHGRSFLEVADAIVIPGAFLLGIGRLGNFADGQIVGRATDAWWAIKFPDAEGFRHPVVLYDGIKNLLLIPLLLAIHRRPHAAGEVAGRFIFWYALPRIFIDLFREYPTELLGIPTGQTLNIIMALAGATLTVFTSRRGIRTPARGTPPASPPSFVQPLAFAALLALSLTIPSDWTQDIPARYGARHPGLAHSAWYPQINTN